MRWAVASLAGTCVLALGASGYAYIERLYAFQEILDESGWIMVGKVESVDAAKRIVGVAVERPLKGTQEFRRVEMHIGLAPPDHAAYMMERLKPGAEVIGFYKRDGAKIASEWHGGGTWFQLYAEDDPAARDLAEWRMSHIEIHLNRTYHGTTAGLIELAEDVLANRRTAPLPDPSRPPVDPGRSGAVRFDPAQARGGLRRRIVLNRDGGPPRGIALADANADERPDIYCCCEQAGALLVNAGGAFEDMTEALRLTDGARSVSWADYNGDGYADVLLSGMRLLTNVGGGFRDDSRLLAAARGAAGPVGAWIDFNGDGLPDAILAGGRPGLRLFENAGKGPAWFAEASDKVSPCAQGDGAAGDSIAVFDYDGDGYADFFYNHAAGVLAHNEGGRGFKPVAGSGLQVCRAGYACGLAVGDFDGDGRPDVFVPGPGRARLYRNNGDGTFTDVTDASGDLAKVSEPSVSAAWADADGDGRLDLLVCYAGRSPRLFLGGGKGRFSEATEAVGLGGLGGVCAAAWADLNDDGYPDLVMNARGRIMVAFNELDHPRDHAALTVQVDVRKGMIGAVVRATDGKDRLLGLRELGGAEGLGGQAPAIAHMAVPAGKCGISVCLSDGRAARKSATVEPGKHRVVFRETEFK
jgi:hypothetical protein